MQLVFLNQLINTNTLMNHLKPLLNLHPILWLDFLGGLIFNTFIKEH